METKHTKGEWRQSHRKTYEGVYSTQVYDEKEKTICTLAWHKVDLGNGVTGTDREANAKLIAAAPDMLEACKEALKMYKELEPCGGWQHVYDYLDSAIKKATI
ncbi:MAG: hypothetical protein IMZ64_00500 [Bacteroidetes bacterium]|nr:hypothetical protein [Bacteroidota bacterium]